MVDSSREARVKPLVGARSVAATGAVPAASWGALDDTDLRHADTVTARTARAAS